jgi:5' nucleotidase family
MALFPVHSCIKYLSHLLSETFTYIGIYVNKNLKLDDLHVYGFDYDYTLSHYSDNLQVLIYDLAKKHLVYEVISFCYSPLGPYL